MLGAERGSDLPSVLVLSAPGAAVNFQGDTRHQDDDVGNLQGAEAARCRFGVCEQFSFRSYYKGMVSSANFTTELRSRGRMTIA
jgi:hypothetical protein